MKTAYLVVLSGQGDTQVALVEKDIWDWIGAPPPAALSASTWALDPATPPRVRSARAQDRDAEEEDREDGNLAHLVRVTRGSLANDRALQIPEAAALFYAYGGKEEVREAKSWARSNGYRIVDTFDGSIY